MAGVPLGSTLSERVPRASRSACIIAVEEERTLALLVCGDGGAGCGGGSQNADGAWARDKTDKCECEGAASYM